MAIRLPMVLPLIVTELTGCASGESAPVTMESSHGKSSPTTARWLRKSATVLSEGIRISFGSSGIELHHVISHDAAGQAKGAATPSPRPRQRRSQTRAGPHPAGPLLAPQIKTRRRRRSGEDAVEHTFVPRRGLFAGYVCLAQAAIFLTTSALT